MDEQAAQVTVAALGNAEKRRLSADGVLTRGQIEAWRRDYNESRPHASLGWLTPVEYAAAAVKIAAE